MIEWLQSNRDTFQEQDEVDVDFFTNEHAFHDLPLDDFIPKAAEFIFTNISNQDFYYIDRINAFNQRIVIGKQTFFFFTTLRDRIYTLNDLNCYNPIHNEIINDFFDSISEEESQNVENFDGKETFREWKAYKIWKCRSFQ